MVLPVLYQGAENVSAGPGFTQSAMDSVFPGFGSYFVAIALFLAFTTMLAYYYIAETNISYLTRNLKSPIHLLKVLMMVVIMYGSINQAKLAWNIGDLGVGLMAWFNIIAILLYKTGIAGIEGLRTTESRKDPVLIQKILGCQMPIFGIR
jgi:AGCS family alanine or glycine:cation symporter